MESRMVEVPIEELDTVVTQVLPHCDDDETWPLGHVRLTVHDGRRLWVAADHDAVVMLSGGKCEEPVEVLIPPRLIPSADALEVFGVESVTLTVGERRPEGTHHGGLRLQAGPMIAIQPAGVGEHLDALELFQRRRDAPTAWAEVHSTAFFGAVHQIRRPPSGVEIGPDYPPPPAWLVAEPGHLRLQVDWPGIGRSEVSVEADVDGAARVMVNLRRLQELLASTSPRAITVGLPVDRRSYLVVVDGDWRALLFPLGAYPSAAELVDTLRGTLADAFGLADVEPDSDGDLPLPFEDQQLYLRVADGEPPVVQVFAVLADEPDDHPELLRMLNELNADVRGCRVFWTRGQVLVETDVPHDHKVAELREAALRIAESARLLAPIVGGIQPRLPGV